MKERLERLETAVTELKQENKELREQLQAIAARLAEVDPAMAVAVETASPGTQRKAKWAVIGLVVSLVVMPVLAFTVGHLNGWWSTVLGALNAVILYLVGPGVYHLLIEGLVRAIPAVLLGQTTRVAIDKVRRKRGWQGRQR